MTEFFVHGSYLVGAALFILGIKRLSRVKTARSGNQMAAVGMLLAIIATLVGESDLGWVWIILGMIVGSGLGAVLARKVEMTAMPELVAFFNGMGGAASAVVALSFYFLHRGAFDVDISLSNLMALGGRGSVAAGGEVSQAAVDFAVKQLDEAGAPSGAPTVVSLILSILVGGVTVTGSLVAFGKLSGRIPGKPVMLPQRHLINLGLFALIVLFGCLAGFATTGAFMTAFLLILVTLLALALGILLVIPIGGADMPVVISLLNSYSGIAASMTGFVLLGTASAGALMLIICGALVGAAGIILTGLMCKAMNRSLLNVLAGGFGDQGSTGGGGGGKDEYTNVKSFSAEEAAMLLDGAELVIIVPGYGLAVAQAQHVLAELDNLLTGRGCEVRYAIHPVAGRMPGHMNVLLAEANVPYEKLYDLDDINSDFKNAQVAIVVGANDVCNPLADTDPTSPIAGMPILNVHEAQNVIVIKRSLSPGYAGIKNPLFEMDNTMMLFEDAKGAVADMVKEVKDL